MGGLRMRVVLLGMALVAGTGAAARAQSAGEAAPQHGENFDTERKKANELYLAGKVLDALPLYEDLCRQDQTIAVFAERHAGGLFAKMATVSDAAGKKTIYEQGLAELRRAQSLGDHSPYVESVLSLAGKSPVGAVISGVPLTVGYTYGGKPAAQAAMQEAEAAFGHNDLAAAVKLYEKAAGLDPSWYGPALYAGDCYFRMKDVAAAGQWFARAIAIDPDRETAYRYWGDALSRNGDMAGGKKKYELAVVAEPYSKPSALALQQWAKMAGGQVVRLQIVRPEFTTPEGKLAVDAALATETGDGRASWVVYEQARVAHGARVLNQIVVAGATDSSGVIHPSGYRHTLKEESESLNAMLDDVTAKLKAGTVTKEKLDQSINNLLLLRRDGMIECWIVLEAADAGIRADYPAYREGHRELLAAFVDRYMVRMAVPAPTP